MLNFKVSEKEISFIDYLAKDINKLIGPFLYADNVSKLVFSRNGKPVIFKNETALLKVEKALKDKGVNTRRYFYPSLNQLSYLDKKQHMPISEHISKCVLCLPLFDDLGFDTIHLITETIKSYLE